MAPPGRLWGYLWHKNVLKSTENASRNTETCRKKQRRPKTFQEHPTLAEVFHRGSDAVRSLPQKLSLRGAASRSLHQKPPAASKFPQRGGLGEAHLDKRWESVRHVIGNRISMRIYLVSTILVHMPKYRQTCLIMFENVRQSRFLFENQDFHKKTIMFGHIQKVFLEDFRIFRTKFGQTKNEI